MSSIIVHQNGADYGPYPLEVAKQYLESGQLRAEQVARLETSQEWSTVGVLLGHAAPPPQQQRVAPPPPEGGVATESKDKQMMLIIYILFAVGLFTGGLVALVGLIMCYVKREEMAASAFLGSHCEWLIKTFWYSLIPAIIGYILVATILGAVIGLPILIVTSIWYIYRIVKGFIRFNDAAAV